MMAQSVFRAGGIPTTYAAAPPAYVVVDLGTLGGSTSFAQAINNLGQITGASSLPGDPTDPAGNPIFHAFLYSNGRMIDIGTLGGASSFGNDINEKGQIVGDSFLPGNPTAFGSFSLHAFLYSDGVTTDLGALGGVFGSEADDINNRGDIVGAGDVPNGPLHGFIYSNGALNELPTSPSAYSEARGINNRGLVVGVTGTVDLHAFTYESSNSGAGIEDLGTLGGNISFAYRVNEADWIVGEAALPGPPDSQLVHAFLCKGPGKPLRDLGTLPGDGYSSAFGVNNLGQVIGDSFDGVRSRPFLWSDGQMRDVNSLIPADSGWQIQSIGAINDLGQMVGAAVRGGQSHAVLLTRPALLIASLVNLLQPLDLRPGIKLSLLAKLAAAGIAVEAGDTAVACNLLRAFINEVSAQSGKALSVAQANQLIAAANQLREAFGCQ
jgi:probable HAF family extracellular repeat protein